MFFLFEAPVLILDILAVAPGGLLRMMYDFLELGTRGMAIFEEVCKGTHDREKTGISLN